MSLDRIIVVTRPTRLQELTERFHTEGGAEFELESRGGSIEPYRQEHNRISRALDTVLRQLPQDVTVEHVSRAEVPHFLFRPNDLVLVCGPDGLLVNCARFLQDQPVLGINLDEQTNAGLLTPFAPEELQRMLQLALTGTCRVQRLPFMKAAFDTGETVWGLNEIFAGRLDQVSARYRISHGERSESQSSSGVIAATGIGCTGWIRSIVTMLEGLTDSRRRPAHALQDLPDYSSEEAVFVVREPFPSPTTSASIVTGRLVRGAALQITCEMPEGGVILSDGITERATEWPAGCVVTITCGERTLRHIVR